MKYQIKGLQIFGLIITTKHQLENCIIGMESEEIRDLNEKLNKKQGEQIRR